MNSCILAVFFCLVLAATTDKIPLRLNRTHKQPPRIPMVKTAVLAKACTRKPTFRCRGFSSFRPSYWSYSSEQKKCLKRRCDNKKGYKTLAICKKSCLGKKVRKDGDACKLPVVGVMNKPGCKSRRFRLRYYFDASKGRCEMFIHGRGCKRNANSFKSMTRCAKRCARNSLRQARVHDRQIKRERAKKKRRRSKQKSQRLKGLKAKLKQAKRKKKKKNKKEKKKKEKKKKKKKKKRGWFW